MILDEEGIQWIGVDQALPDSETTVLVYSPESDEPVWLGYYDGDSWDSAEGMPYGTPVTAWAKMPEGPDRERER